VTRDRSTQPKRTRVHDDRDGTVTRLDYEDGRPTAFEAASSSGTALGFRILTSLGRFDTKRGAVDALRHAAYDRTTR
jgi:hypothetical protein